MTVALLLLLGVTKIQDGGSSKKRIATTKTFYWRSWATEALYYERRALLNFSGNFGDFSEQIFKSVLVMPTGLFWSGEGLL